MTESHQSALPLGDLPQALAHLAGKYMAFQLADEAYALEILKVRELIGLMEITRIPRTSEFVRGVINLRGVVDLRLKFGMAAAEKHDQAVIIVVQVEAAGRSLTMGLLVDKVLEVLSIDASSIEPMPSVGDATGDSSFILGVGKPAGRVVFLLDVGRVLSPSDAGELAHAAA